MEGVEKRSAVIVRIVLVAGISFSSMFGAGATALGQSRPALIQLVTVLPADAPAERAGTATEVLDGLGRLVRVREFTGTSPYGVSAETKYGYDGLDNLVQVVAQHLTTQTITTTIGYDALSRKVQLNDPDMGLWSYGYNGNGNLISQVDAKGQALVFSYDALNRLTQKSQGTLAPSVYQAEGGSVSHQIGSNPGNGAWLSPAAPTTTVAYLTYGPYQTVPQSGPGQVARFRLAIDVVTGTNDLVGLIEVTDFSDSMRVLGQRYVSRHEFGGGLTNFSDFDVHFNTTNVTTTHQLEYRVFWYGKAQMAHDKTTAYWKTGTQTVAAFNYDETSVTPNALGRRTSMATGAGDAYSYFRWGAWGLLEGKYDRFVITGTNQDYATWMTYDRADRLVAQTYPNGDVLTTTYNNASQPVTLRNQTPRTFVSNALYTVLGQPTQVNLFNTQSNRYYYYGSNLNAPAVFGNANYGRLRQTCVLTTSAGECSESQRVAVTPTLLNLTYAYDAVGNVSALDDRTRNLTSTYTYDEQDRLTSWTQGGVPKESYGYNPIGNMVSKTGLGTMSYTDTAHVHALTKITSGTVATYDANGNMVTHWTPTAWFTQEWNIDNRLTRTFTTVSPTLDVRYFYDADSNLVRKLIGGVHTIYVGSHFERNMTTGIMTQYYDHAGRRISMRVGSLTTTTVTFLHGDHLGSASVQTNDSFGGKVAEVRYTPFGETSYQSGALTTDKRFTGQREEIGSGLYDYGARFYVPLFARFISPDSISQNPTDPQSLNRYVYARGNPLKYIDPSGHCFLLAGLDTAACFAIWTAVAYALAVTLPPAAEAANEFGQQAGYAQQNTQMTTPLDPGVPLPTDTSGTTPVIDATPAMGYPLGPAADSMGIETLTAPGLGDLTFTTPLNAGVTAQIAGPLFSQNERGTRVTSKTLFNKNGVRIDVENPNPGKRPGQVHIQTGKEKYLYDPATGQFVDAPPRIQKYLEDKGIQAAIQKGVEKYLGIERWKP